MSLITSQRQGALKHKGPHQLKGMKKCLAFALLLAGQDHSLAARPFVTDDARLTNAGQCQLESWSRRYRDSTELWLMPACNLTGNFEISLGTGAVHTDPNIRSQDYVIQAKTLVRPLGTDEWGWGLALGHVMHPSIHPGPNLMGNTYAYVPVSKSFRQDAVIVHMNLGWLRDKASRDDKLTWGLGTELQLSPRWTGIWEAFGDHRSKPYVQTGLRYALQPNLLQLDLTFGQQHQGPADARWVSFGLRYTP